MSEPKLFTIIHERLKQVYGKPLPRGILQRARTEFLMMQQQGWEDSLQSLIPLCQTLQQSDLTWLHGAGPENGSVLFFALGLSGIDPLLFGLDHSLERCRVPRFSFHLTAREFERLFTLHFQTFQPVGATECEFRRGSFLLAVTIDQVAGFFDVARRLLGKRFLGFKLDAIPLDDQATLDLFVRGETLGILGCSSDAARAWLMRLNPRHFADLLMLPGWLGSAPEDLWERPLLKMHPCLDVTRGWLLFQEQVIDLLRDFGGLSGPEAIEIVFGKSIVDSSRLDIRLDRLTQAFLKNGIDAETALDLARWISIFGPTTMCRGEAVAVMLAAWRMAWMKAHFPFVFAQALEEVASSTVADSLLAGDQSEPTLVVTQR